MKTFKALGLITAIVLTPTITMAASVTGLFSPNSPPSYSATFTPTAGGTFSVTVAPTSGSQNDVQGKFLLVRSQDSGATWAAVSPPQAATVLGQAAFNGPITFDVIEQRSSVMYALYLSDGTGATPVNYRFDQ